MQQNLHVQTRIFLEYAQMSAFGVWWGLNFVSGTADYNLSSRY